MDSGRILLVDDEETFLLSTADLLRRAGYDCDCASDVPSALERLQGADYDLLIADIKMPGNPDLELVRGLAALAKGLPVILVTGYPSLRTAIQSVELSVMAYLVKPLDFNELLAGVQTGMQHRASCRAIHRTREHLDEWNRDLADLEEWANRSAKDGSNVTVSTFLGLTLRNIVEALSDLGQLVDTLAERHGNPDACHLLQCPRPQALTQVIQEAIEVLEKTKGSFKSKELGELRQKMERMVAMIGTN